MTAADRIRGAQLRRDTFRFCADPNLLLEHDRLQAELAEAVEQDSQSFAGARAAAVHAEIEQLLEAVEDVTVTLVLQALPRRKYRALVDLHPPRKDAEGVSPPADVRYGVNYDEFFNDLARQSILGADDGDGGIEELDGDVIELLLEEQLTDGQWEDLTTKCGRLNRTTVDVPFSPASSPTRRRSTAS